MHLKKCKVFSSPRRPETHFRRVHGHQRASVLTRSINIFQSKIITVYEVEHEKTVNTKIGKEIIWFSELIKEFQHYYRKKKLEDTKRLKVRLHCIPKADQSTLQNPMVKSTSCFEEQTRMPFKLSIEKF